MTAADFERRYQSEHDPWGYLDRPYERHKYAATLAACGRGPFASALELGASIGVFTALLAPRCRALVTIDFAPTAVAAAKHRLAPYRHVTVLGGTLPEGLPDGQYDLVIASEILYYLTWSDLDLTLANLESVMVRGSRLVAAHWLPSGADRPLDAHAVHARLIEQPWLAHEGTAGTSDYLLDILNRR